jgi:hypothetical protein
MKLGLKCCFNRLLVVKLGVSLCLLLLMDISLWFSQSTWGGQFIVFHGTIRYYKDLDTIDFDQYLDYMDRKITCLMKISIIFDLII